MGFQMKKIIIEGNNELSGTINISGAKNSAVALIPAAILSDDIVTIYNVPNISDIDTLCEILVFLGAKIEKKESTLKIDARDIKNREISEENSKKLRASYYIMSALFGRFKEATMYFPGGCSIGPRPIDQTLKSYRSLGAYVTEEGSKYNIKTSAIKGGHVYLDMPSVGATVNTLLAAVKADGETIIENAAKEPEIVNIATFLNNMGAKIVGAGTSEIRIDGVSKLGKAVIEIIPDRIEAGTYLIAGALVGKNLKIDNIIPEHIDALISKLKEMGFKMEVGNDYVEISSIDELKPVRIKTLGYPGFATDLQQPIVTLLTQCSGKSYIDETIYETRYKNIPYLNEMGALIEIKDGQHFTISGPSDLIGKEVTATDLRAGASLVLAGLKAKGKTTINEVEHVLRGYENIVEKLSSVGAKITIMDDIN